MTKLKAVLSRLFGSPTRKIVLGFAVTIFVGAFILCLPIAHNDGQWFAFSDALFTATSAVCVTGLIVVDTAVEFNVFGQIIILLLIQLGGLGVMTGATLIFIILGKRISLHNRMVIKETMSGNRIQGVVKLLRNMVIFTLLCELAGAFVLMGSFIPRYGAKGIWPSIFISVSAYCNAGFDILGTMEGQFSSLTAYTTNALVCLPIMALITIGGLGYAVIADTAHSIRGKRRMSVNTKIVLTTSAILIAVGWLLVAIAEWNNTLKDMSVGGKLLASLFQSITPRTAGFNALDQSALSPASYVITLLLMFIGASPASTGGGIKTTTVAVMLIVAARTLKGDKYVNVDKSKINTFAIRKVVTIIAIAVSIISLNTILILIVEGGRLGAQDVFFEVVSAFSTVGLSTGITTQIGAFSKIIIGLTMFIGRVGALTIGASIVAASNQNCKLEYTDAKIMVG